MSDPPQGIPLVRESTHLPSIHPLHEMATQAPPAPLPTVPSHATTSLVNLTRQLGDDAGLLEYAPSHLTEWMDHDEGNNVTKRKVKVSTVPSTTATTAPPVVVWASTIYDKVIFETLAEDAETWNTIKVDAVVASSIEWEVSFHMDDPPKAASHGNILRTLVKFYAMKEDIALPKPIASFSGTFATSIVNACKRFKFPASKDQARKNLKKKKERYLAMLQENAANAASDSLVSTGSPDMNPQTRAAHEYTINRRLNFPELRSPETTNIGSRASTARQHVFESYEQENSLKSVLETKLVSPRLVFVRCLSIIIFHHILRFLTTYLRAPQPTFGSNTIDWHSQHQYDLQSGQSAEDHETIIQEMAEVIKKYNSEIKDENDALNKHRMNAIVNIKRIHKLRMDCMQTKGVYESKLKFARTAASIVNAPIIRQTSDSQAVSLLPAYPTSHNFPLDS